MTETGTKIVENDEYEVSLEDRIDKTIQNHVYTSIGIGFIPVPWIDFLALTGTQLNMINSICRHYGVSFSEDAGKNVISSLVGAAITNPVGAFAGSMIKFIPLVGQTVSVLAMPAIAGSTTYAVGKVVDMHLASGGTLMNFDSKKFKEQYKKFKEDGEKFVKKSNVTPPNNQK